MDFYSICEAFTRLKMSPVFETVHFVLMSLNMRKDLLGSVNFPFERKHPLAAWMSTMMLCFAGGIFDCLFFGKPFATLFFKPEKIAVASVVWYIINFVPGVFTIVSSRPGMTLVIGMKEIQRVYGVYGGVLEATREFPTHYLAHFVYGFLKGAGAEILMFFARLMAGILKPNSHQFVAPNVVFKASTVLSTIFVMEAAGVIKVDHNILFASVIIVLMYFRLCMVWGLMSDPFVPFENLICSIVFGGMWDAYQRVMKDKRNNNAVSANGDSHKLKRS